ncbi:hypothetical protein ACLESD_02790 [Pyxidicoccus sp. 3LFB2]
MRGWQGVLAAVAVELVACGGGDAAKPEELGARVVEALCAREARCGVYASAEHCERDLRQWDWETWLGLGTRYDAALESGRLSYDEDAAERCVAAIRDGDCRLPALSFVAHQRGIEYEPACQVLRAEKPEGACGFQAECGERAYCHYTGGDCDGTCQPRSGEGEAAFHSEQCAPGLELSETSGTCQRPAEEGEVCVQQEGGPLPRTCGAGLRCNRDGGKCQRTGSEGDACVDLFDSPCGTSFVCKEGRCGRRAQKGEACRAPDAATSLPVNECQQELFCDADAQALGTCQVRREEGADCRDSLECAEGLDCVGAGQEPGARGVCERRPGPGEACERHPFVSSISNCTFGLSCSQESDTCVPRVRQGERCGSQALCADGSACSDGRCLPFEALVCR